MNRHHRRHHHRCRHIIRGGYINLICIVLSISLAVWLAVMLYMDQVEQAEMAEYYQQLNEDELEEKRAEEAAQEAEAKLQAEQEEQLIQSIIDAPYQLDNGDYIQYTGNVSIETHDASSISNGVEYLSWENSSVNSVFEFSLGNIEHAGDNYPKSWMVYNSSITTTYRIASLSVEFMIDAAVFEHIQYNSGSSYRVLVNEGDGYYLLDAVDTDGGGGIEYVQYTFESEATRLIKIEGYNFYFAGIILPSDKEIIQGSDFVAHKSVVIIGDSYTEGNGASSFANAYTSYIQRILNVNYYKSVLNGQADG